MNQITITVFKSGLNLEAHLSRLTRQIQKKEKLGYKAACAEAEKRYNPVEFRQVIRSSSEEVDLKSLGEHISKGAPHSIIME